MQNHAPHSRNPSDGLDDELREAMEHAGLGYSGHSAGAAKHATGSGGGVIGSKAAGRTVVAPIPEKLPPGSRGRPAAVDEVVREKIQEVARGSEAQQQQAARQDGPGATTRADKFSQKQQQYAPSASPASNANESESRSARTGVNKAKMGGSVSAGARAAYQTNKLRQKQQQYAPSASPTSNTNENERGGRTSAHSNTSGVDVENPGDPGAYRVRSSLDGRDTGPSTMTFDPTSPLPDAETNSRRSNIATYGETLPVAGRVVSDTDLGQVEEREEDSDDIFVATAEKDSAWRHFKRNRKLQFGLAALLLIVVILVVSLSIALSKQTEPGPEPTSTGSTFWSSFQVPPNNIDGAVRLGKFGASVSINYDGTRMAVGSPGVFEENGTGDERVRRGLVSVYDLVDNEWKLGQEIPLTARDDRRTRFEPMTEVRNEMVVALSRDGRMLAVGAPFHDAFNFTNTGQVEVFEFKNDTWQAAGTPLTGNEDSSYFGASVSLSEDGGRLAIGTPGSSENGKLSGSASFYFFNNDNWVQLGGEKGNIVGDLPGQRLGGSVSISSDGKTVAVGSSATSESTNTRVANVYEFKSGKWEEKGTGMNGGVGLFNTAYDVALSADGERVVISNHYSLSQARDNSEAYKNNADLFVQAFQFLSGDWASLGSNLHENEPGEKSGYYISLDDKGDIILMGDPGRKVESGGNTGHAHLYKYDSQSGTFIQMGPDINGEDAGDLFGFDVAISGDGRLFTSGAPTNRGIGFEYGQVKVYKVPH